MQGPLSGKYILVTRPKGQEQQLMQMLSDAGGIVYHWPALVIEPPRDWTPFDEAITQLNQFDWVVFTSVNGVRMCFDRMAQLGKPASMFDQVRTAAIGPATAQALREKHQSPIVVPRQADAAGLIATLAPDVTGRRVLLLRAEQGRAELRDGLSKTATVDDVEVYRQSETVGPPEDIKELVDRGGFHLMVFTSANGVRAIFKHLSAVALDCIRSGKTKIVVNSAATAAAVVEVGMPMAQVAPGSTDGELLSAIDLLFE